MTLSPGWLERQIEDAPEALQVRVRDYARAIPNGPFTAEDLLAAGRAALEKAVGGPADRSVALDLLAADALVTLALLAQAESAPEAVADFAMRVRRAETDDR